MTAWRPLFPRRPFTIAGVASAVLLIVLITLILVSALGRTGETVSVAGVVAGCGLLALMAVFAWRVGRMGVYLSDRGVRVQYFANSDVVEWADVLRFVVRTSRRGWIVTFETEEIWMVRRDGEPVSTSVIRVVDPPVRNLWQLHATYTRTRDEDFDRARREFEDALARSRA